MNEILRMMLDAAEREKNLCDRCIGRMFGKRSTGISNIRRGEGIRIIAAMISDRPYLEFRGVESNECELCKGIFERIEFYVNIVCEAVKDYEFSTFLIGSRFPKEVESLEAELQSKYGNHGESIRNEFNREVGKALLSLWPDKKVEFRNPEMTITIDTEYDSVELYPKPLLILGRYRKLVRGIPQTKWSKYPERKKYEISVEEIISKKVMEYTAGEEHLFHGMGREDIDARMLGSGRPFVLEIRRPKKRTLDLRRLEEEINSYGAGLVEVKLIRLAEWKDVEMIKSARVNKRYVAKIKINPPIDETSFSDAVSKLRGKVIYQRTPSRVVHRRGDVVRQRKIENIKIVEFRNEEAVLEIEAEAGTYIKELMHGDGGRTSPSLAELINREVSVEYLDVIEIMDGGDENGGDVSWSESSK